MNEKVLNVGVEEAVGVMSENISSVGGQMEEFIDGRELAKRLGISARTVEKWMRCGKLPYYKLGKIVRFKWSEVNVHLKECRVVRELTKMGI